MVKYFNKYFFCVFFLIKIYLFFLLSWVFLVGEWAFSSFLEGGLLIAVASLLVQLGLTSTPAQLPGGMWNLPRPGIKPASPPLACGFFNHSATREAPFKSFNFSHSGASGVIFYCGLIFFSPNGYFTYIILIDHLDICVCVNRLFNVFSLFSLSLFFFSCFGLEVFFTYF